MNKKNGFTQTVWSFIGAVLFALPLSSAAETLMMPDRDALVGEDVVVWGVTDQAGNYTLECGNGSDVTAPVADGSYIPLVCNYASAAVFTATLTVGAEVATAEVQVFDATLLSAKDERDIRVNLAIEDGLRYLWTAQASRAGNFPTSPTTHWSNGWSSSEASLVALAFQNQGYQLPANAATAPTGVYEKYVVQRALNYVIESLKTVALGVTPQGDDPCVGTMIPAWAPRPRICVPGCLKSGMVRFTSRTQRGSGFCRWRRAEPSIGRSRRPTSRVISAVTMSWARPMARSSNAWPMP